MGKMVDVSPIIEWIEKERSQIWVERQNAVDDHDWDRLRECERCLCLLARIRHMLKEDRHE